MGEQKQLYFGSSIFLFHIFVRSEDYDKKNNKNVILFFKEN